MELKPVKQSRNPGYPTIRAYVENPVLLTKNIPLSWIKNKYAAVTLAAFVLCCNPKDEKNVKVSTVIVNDSQRVKFKDNIQNTKHDPVKIAPIFSHGEGHGAIGCEVMSPPVYISEDDSRKIIFDAFKSENIDFDTTNCQTFEFKAEPIANGCYREDKNDTNKADVKLKMDGYNKKYNLAVQYVSIKDFDKFKSNDKCGSSVQSFNTKKAAKLVREELLINSNTNSAVFYDPLLKYNHKSNSKEEAKKLLLAQVEDFIKWIKAEGILNK